MSSIDPTGQQSVVAENNEDLDRSDRLDRWRLSALILAILLVGVATWALLASARQQANDAAAAKAQTFSLSQTVAAACAGNDVMADMAAVCAKVNAIAKQGPAPAAASPGDTGAQGATGPGPTPAQVAAGVADYLALHPAPAGKPGPGPSIAQITEAVTVYLTVHPPAPGLPGADSVVPGINGTNGRDSTVPGPAGPGPTDAQVSASVAAFCAANTDCRGPVGAVGAAGEPPASWTVTDANGRESTCTRTTPFNPASPTYICTPTPTP